MKKNGFNFKLIRNKDDTDLTNFEMSKFLIFIQILSELKKVLETLN